MNHRDWEQANSAYLTAALTWLRLRLAWYAQRQPPAAAAPGPPGPAAAPGPPAVVPPATLITDEQLAAAAASLAAAESSEPPAALITLGHLLGLSRFERDTLLLCVGAALDSSVRELCAQAHGAPYPTFALALAALPGPAWEVLSPDRPLRHWRLLEVSRVAGQPLLACPLQADERIVNHVKGLDYLDDRLEPLLTPLVRDPVGLPPSQQAMVNQVVLAWRGGQRPVVALLGADGRAKRQVAAEAASQLGLTVLALPAELLPQHADDLENLARIWARESLLLPLALYLDADEAPATPAEGLAAPVGRFAGRTGTGLLLASREPWPGLNGATANVDVAAPAADERREVWLTTLGQDTPGAAATADTLAGQFVLDAPAIRTIARNAMASEAPGLEDRLWQGCLTRTRPRLDALAQRLVSKAGWDDIVLPAEELATLHEIADQVAHRHMVYRTWGFADRISRGLGVSALFGGPSGAGKTTAAEVLANHLHLDLHRIDLSTVVDKYIGETEKNLRRLFDAAESGGAILFFDEADALFGKRTQVRESHDRYANIEVNYLLQRMESFTGLAILATNMRAALDPGFVRRLRFIITFPSPGTDLRREIWARALPPAAPRDPDLDLDRLARLPANGGMIRNIALNAAFAAAAAHTNVTMPLLLAAARGEFRKADLPVAERAFAWTEPEMQS